MVQARENVFGERVIVEIITERKALQLHTETAVAIGKFDGLHVGHKKLLEKVLAQKERGMKACVFTFEPSPAVFFGMTDGMQLTTKEEKRKMFEALGIDILVEFPLNKETAAMEPEVFAREVLRDFLHAKYLVAGHDLSFGNRGAGNAQLLRDMSQELHLEVETIDKVYIDDEVVSSTRVRAQVEQGRMETVTNLLGQPYTVMGTVVKGNQLGRTIGFPTINVVPEESKLLPPCGVYFSTVTYDGKNYRAISNIGYKPTVGDTNALGVETYIFDFEEEIYGKTVEIGLCRFHRPERKFDGLEALKEQLQADIAASKIHQ